MLEIKSNPWKKTHSEAGEMESHLFSEVTWGNQDGKAGHGLFRFLIPKKPHSRINCLG